MNINPIEFEYLRTALLSCRDLAVREDFERHIRNLSPLAMRQLASVYNEIQQKDHSLLLSKWIRDSVENPPSDPDDCVSPYVVGNLFGLFELLADEEIKPFSTRAVRLVETVENPDWSNLPEELTYLVDPATRYGRLVGECDVLDYLETATESEMDDFARLAERIRINGHMSTINEFFRAYSFPKHPESSLLYSLLLLLDHAVGLP